ncbi:Murein DD-endopeptidase MepM and murein hydrolase activator NlpD, contain LysM domain [Georgenia satyanarayanai]|uniref:Murein DD-endopeptidase MepM and murein hydrolase activator NlpD, contain LysM domain n=1 Tax=Georgenia satyanarayanai TaxID=860221 RepID=A0A2Y9A669_9MICO|nr:M23 family metallopeptidase [Georgenia satyanarayanai]PYG00532.1 murein DD-endopeptidase MepM/ murein hydrolase activator NlpD [Georgenia satyanarayanai]SSA39921.1 Murein DD-endopeptidase MepM and murein hydrolase activator NlpD, contain LysM domain [Georgenia satyanarayanai]
MPARASMPSTAPVTRRQLREAERRAEQLAVREAAVRAASVPTDSLVATVPLDGTVGRVGEAQHTATAPLGSAPARTQYRSRAELRAAEQAAARHPVRMHAPRWMPRAAVLGALGAATIVAPLAGFVGADEGVAEELPSVATVPAGETVLDALDAAARQLDSDAAGSTAAILADSSASARALVQSSRSVDRDAAVCSSLAGSAANGAGAALGAERMAMPLAVGTYTQSSLYGNRVHPIQGTWSKHEGLDFAAPLGTPIHAVADGVVVHAGEGLDGRSSMLVILEHEIDGQTFFSWYVHMYEDGVFVTEGQQVRGGEVIGEVGNNGNSTGPHLHLEIHLDESGTTTDPGAFLADRDAVMIAADC